jgi:Flp pilus assembly protein TadG
MTRRPKLCWPFGNPSTFGRSESGGLTATMVLSSTLLVVALGATVDFGRYVSARTALQAAIDGAALQGATSSLTGAELTALVQQSVTQNFNSDDYGEIAVSASITDSDTLLVEAQLTFETDFIRIGGSEKFDVSVEAEATLAQKTTKSIEVALAVDASYTSQMPFILEVMPALRSFYATILADDGSGANRRVAMIPYSNLVNLSTGASAARGVAASGTCSTPGCASFSYTWYNKRLSGTTGTRTASIKECVTDRTGDYALTDEALSNGYVGRFYGTTCVNTYGVVNGITGLTSNSSDLETVISDTTPSGSRASHIGFAWAWYALSPNFGYFTDENAPAAYGDETVKVAILTARGDSDVSYCNGVTSSDTASSYETFTYKINCAGTNGDPDVQAKALCTNMKAKGIIIYAVGIGIASNTTAQDVLSSCASSAATYHLIDSSSDLEATLNDIASDVLASAETETDNSVRLIQ